MQHLTNSGTDPLSRLLRTRRPHTLLVLFCLVLWLPGFFSLPPSDRDEARFAQATKQMLQTGDFIHIRNGPEARYLKPIGIYWAQLPFVAAADALSLGGDNPIWPYRVPSLVGALVAVLATYRLGIALVGKEAALAAALMLAASLVLTVEHDIAKTDAALLGTTTLAMGVLSRAWRDPAGVPKWQAWLFWLALAAGVLLKGPITPMIAGLTMASLLIAARWRGEKIGFAWFAALRPRAGVLIFLAVTLPWFAAIGVLTRGQFFVQALGHDLGGKIAGVSNGHGAPPGVHLMLLSLTLFPSGFVVISALPSFWRARGDFAGRFLLAWIVPSWLVFEVAPTKLPHYPLPLFPAVLLLAATWLVSPERRPPPLWLHRLAFILFGLAAALLGLCAFLLPLVAAPGLGLDDLLGAPGLAAALVLAIAVLRPGWAGDTRRALGWALLLVPLLYWVVLEVELPQISALWIAPRVAAALGNRVPNGVGFGALGYQEPSLRFVCGTATQFLPGPVDAARFLTGEGKMLLVDGTEQRAFLTAAQSLGHTPDLIATIHGFDTGRGRRVTLWLYTRIPER